MNRLWNSVMRPILEGIHAKYIVEVGSDDGINTRNILEYCRDHDAHMTAIDPLPKFDVDQYQEEYGDKFEIYQELSLDRLPQLEDYDAILLDGDHNWYTVYHELKAIEESFKNKEKFPIIFLHDVGWPYSRRDLYYDPETIPQEYRHQYQRQGILPGQSHLAEKGGLNPGLFNSINDNDHKNGVLTALEDFREESQLKLSFRCVDAFFGLGILSPQDPELDEMIETVVDNVDLAHILEKERVKLTIAESEARSLNHRITSQLEETEDKLGQTEEELSVSNELIRKKDILIQALKKKERDLGVLSGQLDNLTARFYELEYQSNKNRSFKQKLISKFPSLYIILNRNNQGLKNTYLNIKGHHAIRKNHLFNIGYYLQNNGDVRVSGADPLLHYLYHGYQEGRNPHPQFDTKYYTQTYPDVQKSKLNPLIHYSLYGKKEKRKTYRSRTSTSELEILEEIDSEKTFHRQVRGKPEKLNIAYVLWDFPALSQTFVMNELRWLVENNYNVKVFYKTRPDKEAKLDFEIEAIHIEDAPELIKKIKEHDINVMHTHFVYPACTLLTYPAAEATGVPFTISAHAIDIFHHLNDERNKIGEISRNDLCLRIYVPGKFHFNYLAQRGVPEQKIMFLRQATSYEIEKINLDDPRFKREIKNVITIARFIEKKGIDTLIEAAKILENEDLTFKIYGYGPLEEDLKKQCEELDLKNVIFEGPIKGDAALKESYQDGDIFILPCRRAANGDMDGMPTVIFEAMAYGIPVITTNVSSIPEFVLNDYSGFVVDPDDPSALASKILHVKNLPLNDLTATLRHAQEQVQKISNVNETIETMVDIWSNHKIDIFMVTYQKGDYKDLETMKDILDRIFRHTTLDFDLTIIDNGSDEDFKNFLLEYSQSYPNISLIFLKENIQCGPASNLALEKMENEFAIYICSNEGFVLEHDWEREALSYMKKHPQVGIAGNLIHSPSFYNGRTYREQEWFKKFRNKEHILGKDDVPFRHVQGGAYILRRAAYQQSGGFNPLLPQGHMDVEYSYYLESNGWELGEVPGWVSLSKKTRPGVFTFLDENTTLVHPLRLEETNQMEQSTLNCNICHGQLKDNICTSCNSDSSERAIYRIIGKTDKTHRSLTCTLLLDHNSIHNTLTEPFFKLVNQKYSKISIKEPLVDVFGDLTEQTDVLITNMDLGTEYKKLLTNIIDKLSGEGMLVLQLSNDQILNNQIKEFLSSQDFSIESFEFVSLKLTNKEFIVVERLSHV